MWSTTAILCRRPDRRDLRSRRPLAHASPPPWASQIGLELYTVRDLLAGLKHFVIEQNNAAAWGDSLAAARVSFQNLQEMLAQN